MDKNCNNKRLKGYSGIYRVTKFTKIKFTLVKGRTFTMAHPHPNYMGVAPPPLPGLGQLGSLQNTLAKFPTQVLKLIFFTQIVTDINLVFKLSHKP